MACDVSQGPLYPSQSGMGEEVGLLNIDLPLEKAIILILTCRGRVFKGIGTDCRALRALSGGHL